MSDKLVVGWNEIVDLPDWGVRRLAAKVDTGAASSALHVDSIELLRRDRIRFEVVVHRTRRDRRVPVTAQIVRRAKVRSSNGQFERRYFVRTRLRLGPVEKEIEISLVDRARMVHRMLLGRSALAGDFLVDVSRRHLLDGRA
ncbi:MAG: ATP-dependent zinc protease [Spirochaetaceae bacterium]|nr:ATP-dependent zinc protease [Myxococcales bacterium]MCB9724206.1 ATP-dependent zinc protease [Spirochaetaceae bacterium]HPG27580.1 RimK/LysX family protein [Myxococcota bacterium]